MQDFLRLGNRRVMDFTFFDRAFNAVRPETWKRINEVLAKEVHRQRRIDPSARVGGYSSSASCGVGSGGGAARRNFTSLIPQ